MAPAATAAALALLLGTATAFPITLRNRHMSTVGRQEWIVNNTVHDWAPAETAIVVVDMWK